MNNELIAAIQKKLANLLPSPVYPGGAYKPDLWWWNYYAASGSQLSVTTGRETAKFGAGQYGYTYDGFSQASLTSYISGTGAFYDVMDINIGAPFVMNMVNPNADSYKFDCPYIFMNDAGDSGKWIEVKVIMDGVTKGQAKWTHNGITNQHFSGSPGLQGNYRGAPQPIYCESRFQLQMQVSHTSWAYLCAYWPAIYTILP